MSLGCLGITDCLKCPTNPICNPGDDTDDDDSSDPGNNDDDDDDDNDKCPRGTYLDNDKCLCKDIYLII